jgi:deazaflavin-dependent oxidoreductase (nitroreductase family)
VPIPLWVTRVNRVLTNRVTLLVSDQVPPLATVCHRGRRSGRPYRTPVLAFRSRRGVVIALTYGPTVDWLRNVLAAGSFTLARGGRAYRVADLARVAGPAGSALLPDLPAWTRVALRIIDVDEFLVGSVRPLGRPR